MSNKTDTRAGTWSGWTLKDTIWMLGVYGATVGTGTLFLPVEIGTRGPMVFFMLLLLGLPLSIVPHVLICRIFMRDSQTEDKSLPLFGTFFGPKGKKAIRAYFCIAHFPVTLVYAISLVNALADYLDVHMHIEGVNRAVLAFFIIAALFAVLSQGRDRVIGTLSALALAILLIVAVQIPGWQLANFTDALQGSANMPAGETIKNLWLTLPLITFAFCSAPLISPLASYYREKGNGGEVKSVRVIRAAYCLIFVSIIFFVLSCILSTPHETFVNAKAQNLNVLSVMTGSGGYGVVFYVAPFIAIIGMTKSFLGISLPVAETFSYLLVETLGFSGTRGKKKAKLIACIIMFAVAFAVVYANPNVITLIETFCGPLIAIFLFLIPAYLVYTRSALRPLRGLTAITVIIGGVATVSALLYSMA